MAGKKADESRHAHPAVPHGAMSIWRRRLASPAFHWTRTVGQLDQPTAENL